MRQHGPLTHTTPAVFVQSRVRYKEARPSTSCESEVQTRSQQGGWQAWKGEVSGRQAWQYELCVVEQTRTHWLKVQDKCRAEVQSRTKQGHDAWSRWTGENTATTCTENRVRYNSKEAPVGKCVAQKQNMTANTKGERVWTGDEKFSFDVCEEIDTKEFWHTPIQWGAACKRAVRARRRPAGTTGWSPYGTPTDYLFEHCTQYRSRTMNGNIHGGGMAGGDMGGGMAGGNAGGGMVR